MKSVFEWFAERSLPDGRTWLILGKGPSFALKDSYDLSRFHLLSLNHAVREQKVLLAHVIDYEVVGQLGDVLTQHADFVVMPWIPHARNAPATKTLAELADADATLGNLRDQDRLLWYNLDDAPLERRRSGSPLVRVRYFSVEAALNLLATAGVRCVRSLGIDGGATYSPNFNDLKEKTLLANSRSSFDVQFQEIARTILTTGIDYAPLHVEAPIRVYVGTQEAQMLATRVLEYSIKKHTSMTVELFPLHRAGIEIPVPKDARNRPRTPFTFQRFLIPALAGRRGHALYLDSDMQVFADMRSLWALPFDGAQVLASAEPDHTTRRPQFSVMLLDCASLDWDVSTIVAKLDDGRLGYESLVYELGVAETISATIPSEWNSLERYEPGKTCLLHYTDMNRQPWLTTENPLGYLWMNDLIEAVDSGFISRDEVREHVERGYVRPSLLYQVDHRDAYGDGLSLLREARRSDRHWSPPAKNPILRPPSPWLVPHRLLRALARYGASAAREVARELRGARQRIKLRYS